MGPREIMLEHLEFWTSPECPPMSDDEIELVKKLARVVGVKVVSRLHLETEKPDPVFQALGAC